MRDHLWKSGPNTAAIYYQWVCKICGAYVYSTAMPGSSAGVVTIDNDTKCLNVPSADCDREVIKGVQED